jgi:FtsP/CotA-like multicopper oxidase with cupredoxin domain
MAADAIEPRSSSLDSADGMGIRKRLSLSLEAEQGQRLLFNDLENHEADDDKEEDKEEWHLRTGWAIAGSLFAAGLVFLLMVLFTRYYIVEDIKPTFNVQEALSSDFRRAMSDYILDQNWNYNTRSRVRKFQWTILDRVTNPDGVYRPMITINGKFPGPMIECNEEDTLVIDVDNQSVNATSIHFHGIFQNGTNWMDGTNGVTQCPIAPKGKFQYRFTVNGQSGTYFYHGHQAVQIADGLFG